jgi:hypothetical protein
MKSIREIRTRIICASVIGCEIYLPKSLSKSIKEIDNRFRYKYGIWDMMGSMARICLPPRNIDNYRRTKNETDTTE